MIIESQQPSSVLAIDNAKAFIDYAKQIYQQENLSFALASAETIPAEDSSFDTVVSGLALNFMPKPEQVLAEMIRVAKPNASIAAYVWDYAEGMDMLRAFWDTAKTLDSEAASLDEALRFPLCNEAALTALFKTKDLGEISFKPIETTMVFKDFDDYWQPFLGGVGPAPHYIAKLQGEQRQQFKTELQQSLKTEADGTIQLKARALAIKSMK